MSAPGQSGGGNNGCIIIDSTSKIRVRSDNGCIAADWILTAK